MITIDILELSIAVLTLIGSFIGTFVMIKVKLSLVESKAETNQADIKEIKAKMDNKNEEIQATLNSIDNKLNKFIGQQEGINKNLERLVNDHDIELKDNRKK